MTADILMLVKVLGLVLAGLAFVVWQFADLRRARKALDESRSKQKR